MVNAVNSEQWTVKWTWTVNSEQYTSETSEQWTVNSEQWTVNSEQWTVNSEQWTVNSEQWTVNSEQWTVNSEPYHGWNGLCVWMAPSYSRFGWEPGPRRGKMRGRGKGEGGTGERGIPGKTITITHNRSLNMYTHGGEHNPWVVIFLVVGGLGGG